MKLNTTWKLVIGLSTMVYVFLPIVLMVVWFASFTGILAFSEVSSPEPPLFFMLLMPPMMLLFLGLGLLRIVLVAFYQAHAILFSEGSKFYRVLLSLGNLFLPWLCMPIYFLIFIWPDTLPDWAGEVST